MDCLAAALAGLARLAERFGFLALLEWRLGSTYSDTLDAQERSADFLICFEPFLYTKRYEKVQILCIFWKFRKSSKKYWNMSGDLN